MSNPTPASTSDSERILDDVIIRPNFFIPEAEKSALLKVFVTEKCWEEKKNFAIVFRLKNSKGEEKDVTVGFIFDPASPIPDDTVRAIKGKHKFFGAMPPTAESPVLALVSLVALEEVSDGTFSQLSVTNSLTNDDLLRVDFIVLDGERFSELMNSWHSTNEVPGAESGEEQNPPPPLVRQSPSVASENVVFLERIRGLYTTHYCNEYFKMKLTDQPEIPKDCQHMAIRNQYVIWATPRQVGSTGFKANLYKRKGKNPTGYWPPQLRRYGNSIYWSQHSGKELMRWKDSDNDDYHEAQIVGDLKKHDMSVRRIAAADMNPANDNQLTIVVMVGADWKILFFKDVESGKFEDLKCPLRSLDSVAVLNGVIYAMGCWSDSLFPDVMIYYKDGKWSPEIKRIRDILPNAFFPLDGRLCLFANGLETIEVFDPQQGKWSLNRIPRDMNDICGFSYFNIAPGKHSVKVLNEI